MVRILLAIALGVPVSAVGQQTPPNLRDSARHGRTSDVEALLAKGADIEMKDKEGRTPLMLAAQYGHAAAVKLLLAKGAKAGARDARGWNAYMLALLAPAGGVMGVVHGKHDAVLRLLPRPKRFRVQVNAGWTPGGSMFSSCFMRPAELLEHVRDLRPDAMVLDALQRYVSASGRDMVAIVRAEARGTAEFPNADPAPDVDGTLDLAVQPGIACVQGVDRLSMTVRVKVVAGSGGATLAEREFGTSVKTGMKSEDADNPNQHGPIFAAWAKSKTGPIYWTLVEALLMRD
ncbi:MAG: ankyrin repeat domain-containing protein [Acidobacteriota bacterium]|nr:ankyrin repeat domain-containing protein [Acidobacteriota bacterium]